MNKVANLSAEKRAVAGYVKAVDCVAYRAAKHKRKGNLSPYAARSAAIHKPHEQREPDKRGYKQHHVGQIDTHHCAVVQYGVEHDEFADYVQMPILYAAHKFVVDEVLGKLVNGYAHRNDSPIYSRKNRHR